MTNTFSRRRLLGYGMGLGMTATAAAATTAGAMLVIDDDAETAPAYDGWRARQKGALDDLAYLALCSGLAPSAHNTQPWRFRLAGDRIEVHADRARHLGSADADRRMMQVSLGCAIENVVVAARRLGYDAAVEPVVADVDVAATGPIVAIHLQRGATHEHPWFDAVFERRTHRGAFDTTRPITPRFMAGLVDATDDLPGIGLHWYADAPTVSALETVVRDSVRGFLTPARHRDGMAWFRITRHEWETRRDGIAIFRSDAPIYARRYVEWFATDRELLGDTFRLGEIESIDRVVPHTAQWGLVYADNDTTAQRIQGGRLAERVALQATSEHLSMQPLCYPTELAEGRRRLAELAGLRPSAAPLYLFRIGHATPRGHSVRRRLDDTLMT